MKTHIAPHLLGKHQYSEGPKYRFTLTGDLVVWTGVDLGEHSFADEAGNIWAHTQEELLCVRKNYATDGCSPKIKVLGLWVGTPDFAWTRMPSTVHDAIYQFSHIDCFPLTRKEGDQLFYDLMISEIKRMRVPHPKWAALIAGGYRNAVMTAGVPFYHFGTATKGRTGSCLFHYEN
jgi:hypothetical protein